MAGAAETPAPSGARLTGDDVQHAVAWHAALRTLVPHADVKAVTVEAFKVGNVDDVVVDRTAAPADYIQVKAAVSAERPATIEWLTKLTRAGGPSILQRFHQTGRLLRGAGPHPQLTLVTNRSIDPQDPVLTLRDRNDRLADRLRHATARATVDARTELLHHLGCTDDDLHELLSHLRLRTDASEAAWRDQICDISHAAGVRADGTAFRLGIAEVREWVKTDRTAKRADDIDAVIDRLGLRAHEPFTIVAINALDEHVIAPDARITLNWVARFRGTEARDRRGLIDPGQWENALRPELVTTQRTLRSIGARRILLTGTMRLPTWFTAAAMLSETAGFTPAKIKDGEVWTKPATAVRPAPLQLSQPVADLPPGIDVALALAISADLTDDVTRYLAANGQHMPVVTVRLPDGVTNTSITGSRHAYAVALAIRDLARSIRRTLNPPVLHLFMAMPAALAVLLGGMWDRVPTTRTYEDLCENGYEPAFLIPN
ncbi:SAVED domain-containing protein [Micromonospora sp. WMMC264]|uniref:SAVED domain-containing protein n=1 Tax=Micromonospora sp. WMMC264 TaxID=3015158 RepID=UPI00248BFE52|nr:SAVED domain-containing protein [Micromonospora sp. WMMC264]WBB84713.1 SAVED domain-containing protein [Micromonospora sp. WMMC264]